MLLQFDRVVCYPKEVYDEDDKLTAAVHMNCVCVCDFFVSSRLRQVTHFFFPAGKRDPNHTQAHLGYVQRDLCFFITCLPCHMLSASKGHCCLFLSLVSVLFRRTHVSYSFSAAELLRFSVFLCLM